MIIIRIICLYIFWNIVKKHPKLLKYSDNTQFNVYRSLMCLYFTLYSLENSLNNLKEGYNNPFSFTNLQIKDITRWFVAYISFDLLKMIYDRDTRIDLYIHHIWCLGSVLLGKYFGSCSYFYNFLLINEAISIVSGIDRIALEEKNYLESKKYKIYRKNVIKYIRLPIWIITLLITLKHTQKIHKIIWWNGILTSLIMIYLDRYWERKCDKVIKKKL